jgi:hypothetical protein
VLGQFLGEPAIISVLAKAFGPIRLPVPLNERLVQLLFSDYSDLKFFTGFEFAAFTD